MKKLDYAFVVKETRPSGESGLLRKSKTFASADAFAKTWKKKYPKHTIWVEPVWKKEY